MLRKIIIFAVITILLSVVGLLFFMLSSSGEYYKSFSPDNQYSVYTSKYHYENLMRKMPGQSGDAVGKVFLYDEMEKKILNSAKIPMLWMTGEIIWEENEAYFKGTDYANSSDPWHLPRPIKMPYTRTEHNDSLRTIREYSASDQLSAFTTQKQISTCWKPVIYQAYDGQGRKMLDWQIYYSKESGSSCDFTAYYAYYRHYQNGKLIRELFKYSACDDCEAQSCGTETVWNESGKSYFKRNMVTAM